MTILLSFTFRLVFFLLKKDILDNELFRCGYDQILSLKLLKVKQNLYLVKSMTLTFKVEVVDYMYLQITIVYVEAILIRVSSRTAPTN